MFERSKNEPRGTDIDPRECPLISSFFRDFLTNGEFSVEEGLGHFLSNAPSSSYDKLLKEIEYLYNSDSALSYGRSDRLTLKHGQGAVARFLMHLVSTTTDDPESLLSEVCGVVSIFIGSLPFEQRYRQSAEAVRLNSPVLCGFLAELKDAGNGEIDAAVAKLSSTQRRVLTSECELLYRTEIVAGEKVAHCVLELCEAGRLLRMSGVKAASPIAMINTIFSSVLKTEFGSESVPLFALADDSIEEKSHLVKRVIRAMRGEQSAWEGLSIPGIMFLRSGEIL